ncbi:hypothetical protein [Natrarchaeobius chitinivorans]|uniref:Uncharacterized protein n=1 Tax=Natrarchaeobius chitinivorans TaxID=1679083 RepID=A0A3N6LN35_NATCH|nr:hypothetical protein [Natrarchaeobius chitinivorans]RQG90688.1 hypothetical protein EA473_20485 [Natrarchaeobius chitinivorans]
MTRKTDTENDERTMANVSHTNPYTGRSAGQLFNRGPIVAADGGERAAGDRSTETDADEDSTRTMKGVDHTPPNEADDANRVFERGRRPVGDDE